MDRAVFYDGQSNRRHAVTLVFGDRLEIAEEGAPPGTQLALWPYDKIRRADGPVGALRLSCTTAPPLARLELRDPAARDEILRRCPALDGHGSATPLPPWRIVAVSLAAAAAIAGMVWFGMPLVANRLAAILPYAWEKPLGAAVDRQVRMIFGSACTKSAGAAALRKLTARLEGAAQLPIPPEPMVLRSTMANAFALPGGKVYVLSALLTAAKTPDELAGVLSHEFGHVMHRDGLRKLIREGGTSFLVGMMFGDVTGSGAVLMAGRAVLSASYSRGDESRADAFAVTVMHQLGRPTEPLGALLTRMTHGHGEGPLLLRDHPLTPERAAMLKAENRPATGAPLLDDGEWQELKRICDK
jgi:predicted Zn-dependent protease